MIDVSQRTVTGCSPPLPGGFPQQGRCLVMGILNVTPTHSLTAGATPTHDAQSSAVCRWPAQGLTWSMSAESPPGPAPGRFH